jgi:hypothetical protein
MTDTPATTSRLGALQPKARDDQRVATPGPALPAGRLDLRGGQRELVRASLIARPPAGEAMRDRRR